MNAGTDTEQPTAAQGVGCLANALLVILGILALMYGGIRAEFQRMGPMTIFPAEAMELVQSGPWGMFTRTLKSLPDMSVGKMLELIFVAIWNAPVGWWAGTIVGVLIGMGIISGLTTRQHS